MHLAAAQPTPAAATLLKHPDRLPVSQLRLPLEHQPHAIAYVVCRMTLLRFQDCGEMKLIARLKPFGC